LQYGCSQLTKKGSPRSRIVKIARAGGFSYFQGMVLRLWFWIVFLAPSSILGQIVFDTVYSSNSAAKAEAVVNSPDGGYVLAGGTRKFGDPNGDIFAMKIDSLGELVWEYPYGGQGQFNLDHGRNIIRCQSGGYAIGGMSWTNSHGYNDMSLTRIDENGIELWMKTYGGGAQDDAYGLSQCSDGGFYLVGGTASYGAGSFDLFLVRTDSLGDTLWSSVLGGPSSDWGFSVMETWDGGALVCGGYDLFDGSVWILRYDAVGDTVWTRKFKFIEGSQNRGNGIFVLPDTSYIIGGTGLIGIKDNGDTLWTAKDLGTRNLSPTNDGGFVSAGGYFLTKYDSTGSLEWQEFNPEAGALDGIQSVDGGYLVVGAKFNLQSGHYEVFARKTNCYGIVEQDSTCIAIPPDTTEQPVIPFEIQLYPNPAADQTTFEIQGLRDGDQIDLVLFDNIGRRVLIVEDVPAGENSLNLTEIAAGLYYFRIALNGMAYRTDKLLIRK
jgi:hypothetical protein